jgi:hypothetical protein
LILLRPASAFYKYQEKQPSVLVLDINMVSTADSEIAFWLLEILVAELFSFQVKQKCMLLHSCNMATHNTPLFFAHFVDKINRKGT